MTAGLWIDYLLMLRRNGELPEAGRKFVSMLCAATYARTQREKGLTAWGD